MWKQFSLCAVLVPSLAASAQFASRSQTAAAPAPNSCPQITLGLNGALNGFVPSSNDLYHQDISAMPVDPNSDEILIQNPSDLANYHLHPDFGTVYGVPYNVVDTSTQSTQYPQQAVPFTLYRSQSDNTYYPVQPGMAIEGNAPQCANNVGDAHLLILDRNTCTGYELYQANSCNGNYTADNGVLFDFTTTEMRPFGFTSADASGLSVFEGLIRYDEILAGSINHAIRFTAPHTREDGNGGYFVAPASHASGTLYGTRNIMGMKIRLKANYDISGFSPTNQIILTAMKTYGLLLADNGSSLYFQGTQDSRWNDDDLVNLESVVSNAFEVVQMPPVYDSQSAPTGPPPFIMGFHAEPSTVNAGMPVQLTANVTGGTYSFINQPGDNTGSIFRGSLVVRPMQTTTYTLTSRNQYGTMQSRVTVRVAP